MKPSETSSTYVPSRFANSLLRLAEQRQFDIKQILLNAGLDFNPLDDSAPEHISAIHYSRIYQQVLTLLQDDSFGMPPGKGISAGAFRMMCYAIIHCDTLSKSIHRLCEFFEVFYSNELRLTMFKQGDMIRISYPEYKLPEQEKWQAGEAYALALWHRFFSWLIAMPIELSEVRLITPSPSDGEKGVKRYKRLFGVKPNFASAQNGFVFHRRFLELPVAQNEQSLRDFLRTAPYQMMVEPQQADNSELVSKVKRVMGYDLSAGFPAFETVADSLNMSPPTLRRHLRKEGVSYQSLKDQLRRDAAIAYLSRPELSVSAVSALMGFTDPSAFHRSFKKWTGVTPGQYRLREFSIERDD
ncbi:MAG: AraC family transcriptional regulator ligand-binding domain-containing protein [Pseudomonadales bacterium]|nr:AraC family transcriptional regulator ligand-binding domain-containing protein [Pseudomonadales bacterium]